MSTKTNLTRRNFVAVSASTLGLALAACGGSGSADTATTEATDATALVTIDLPERSVEAFLDHLRRGKPGN